MLAPHAGYMASGLIAAHAFSEILRDGLPEAYVVIGPDHYGIPYDMAMCSEPYVTPLGVCDTHREISERLAKLIPDSPASHRLDHSVEVEIPFLQYIDPDPHVVTVILSRQDISSARFLADAIREATEGIDTLVIASSDLCHYIPDGEEKRLDSRFLECVRDCDVNGIYRRVHEDGLSVCGFGPIAAAIVATGSEHGSILAHNNSWDTLHYDENAVVGYAAASFV